MNSDQLLAELGRGAESPTPADVAPGPEAEEALSRIRALSEAFEDRGCVGAQRDLLGLEVAIATALGREDEAVIARARRDYLAAVSAYLEGDAAQAAELMRSVEAAYRKVRQGRRRCHAETMAVRYDLEAAANEPDRALEGAVAALDGVLPAEDGDDVLEYARRLAGDVSAAPVRESSARYFAGCARIAADAGSKPVELSMQVRLGGALVALGLPERGLELLVDAAQVERYGTMDASGKPQPLDEAFERRYWIARAYDRMGRLGEAERAYRSHRWRSEGSARGAEIATRLAELVANQGRLEEALELVAPLAGASLPPEYAALAAALEARIQAQLGRYAAASARANEAVAALDRAGLPRRSLLPSEEEFDHALERSDAREHLAAVVAGGAGARADGPGLHAAARSATARANLALVQRALAEPGGLDEAERRLRAAAATIDSLGGDAGPFRLEAVQAALLAARGKHSAAVERLEAALDLELGVPSLDLTGSIDEVGAPVFAVELRATREGRGVGTDLRCRLAAERVAAGAGDEAELDAAIAAAGERNLLGPHCDVLLAKARWLTAAGRPDEATGCLRVAVDVIEGLRTQLSDTELQVTALAERETVYGLLLQVGQAAGESAEAQLATMERAKGRALLNALPVEDRPPADAERLLLVARRERHDLLQELRRRFAEHDPDPARLEAARGRLAAAYRAFHRPNVGAPRAAASVDRLRELATDGTVLVHYFRVADGFVAGVIADGAVHPIVPLEDCAPEQVAELLEAFAFERDALASPRSLSELHRLLIRPLEPVLEQAVRLLVIPHDVLHGVPFHALADSAGRPLLERLAVRYAPSGAIALRARERTAGLRGSASSIGFAVDNVPYMSLAELGAGHELRAVAAAVPGLEPHEGAQAVRARLLERTGGLDVLHLACHGEFDEADPLLSRLYLADGPVYGYEILSLAARPRMVVLSACESGIQARYPGDELYGLVRAFVAVGAAGVVSTLWAVPDESSSLLMETFYRHWRDERGAPADALRAAQLDLCRSKAYAHPRYWAPYFLIGE